jgi:hypothetical protein
MQYASGALFFYNFPKNSLHSAKTFFSANNLNVIYGSLEGENLILFLKIFISLSTISKLNLSLSK